MHSSASDVDETDDDIRDGRKRPAAPPQVGATRQQPQGLRRRPNHLAEPIKPSQPSDYDDVVYGPMHECGLPERMLNWQYERPDTHELATQGIVDDWHRGRNLLYHYVYTHRTGNQLVSLQITEQDRQLYEIYKRDRIGRPAPITKFAAARRLFLLGARIGPEVAIDLNDAPDQSPSANHAKPKAAK